MSRKNSKGMFANVLGQLEQPPATAIPRTTSPHLLKVAAGVRQIQEKGEALDQFLKDGEHILELSPDDVAPSDITDRFEGAYEVAAVDEIIVSMRERGQIVPGLVRPRKGEGQPYQIVFGRRRLAAAHALGIKFRAIVRELSDEQAIIFQGEENTNRNDLSFIEKCAFALAQEQAGYKRDVICASLNTGKSHVSEMLQIATALPRDVLLEIGPAAGTGRRRWLEFSQTFASTKDASKRVISALGAAGTAISDERFQLARKALRAERTDAEPTIGQPGEICANGFLLATVSYPKSGARLSFTKSVPPSFVRFLTERMEALHSEFVRSSKN